MRYLVVLLVLLGLLVNFTHTPIAEAAASKKVVKVVAKKAAPKKVVVVKGKKTAPAKNVKGSKTNTIFYSLATLIACIGPDGKNFKATKTDCDAINAFWNSHKPSTPSHSNSNNSGNNNNSSNNSSNSNNNSNPAPTATPTPTPVVPTITSIVVTPCTSSSCIWYRTITVNGTNFTPEARVELSDENHVYNENTTFNSYAGDAQYMGGDGSTKIITDFYNIALCKTYSATVYFPNGTKTVVQSFEIACK